MTREEEIELIEAFSDGSSERYSTSALQRLRLAWSLASNEERAIFKAEIARTPEYVKA
jgi:hypothetical protein